MNKAATYVVVRMPSLIITRYGQFCYSKLALRVIVRSLYVSHSREKLLNPLIIDT